MPSKPTRLDRRTFLRFLGGSLVFTGLIIEAACESDTSGSPGSSEQVFFRDNLRGPRSSPDWINVRYTGGWEVGPEGGAITVLPSPSRKAIAEGPTYMVQPVILRSAETGDVTVEADLQLHGSVEAGLVVRSSFDESYGVVATPERVALVRHDPLRRQVLEEAAFSSDGVVHLRLEAHGERIEATVSAGGRSTHLSATDDPPLGPGLVGLLANPVGEDHGGRAVFANFSAAAQHVSDPAPPHFAYRFAGVPVETDSGITGRLTARTVVPEAISFEVSHDADFSHSRTIGPVSPAGRLGAARGVVEGLAPSTTYHWRPVAGNGPGRVKGPAATFRTPPGPGEGFTFGYASCTSGRDVDYQSWRSMAAFDPDFLIHSGDWGYADGNALAVAPDHFQARWIRQLRAPTMERLLSRATLAFWQDDHDYETDNCWSKTVRPFTVTAFDELHANPSKDNFEFRWGDVQIWTLDCRLHATNPALPDGPDKSRIGIAQREWLMNGMANSSAPVRIVASAMAFRNKNPLDPGWQKAYAWERDHLLSFFGGLDATVLILSGDSHGQRLIHHFEYGNLFEITSSGTDFNHPVSQPNWDPEHTLVDLSVNAFAVVTLDPAGPNRHITTKVRAREDGHVLFEKSLPVA